MQTKNGGLVSFNFYVTAQGRPTKQRKTEVPRLNSVTQ